MKNLYHRIKGMQGATARWLLASLLPLGLWGQTSSVSINSAHGSAQFPNKLAQTREFTPAEILGREAPAIVAIYNMDAQGKPRALGTGFIVKPDGVVITNFHVIEGASDAVMKLKTTEEFDRPLVVDYDRQRDLAVLKYRATGLPTVSLGDSDAVQGGEPVVAIGNPSGLDHTISNGLISAVRIEGGTQTFQTSVAVSPGSSGGPLYNSRGQVIGIIRAQLRGEGVQNINFAIPLKYALLLLQEPRMAPMAIGEFTRQFAPPEAPPPTHPAASANTYTDPSGTATVTLQPGWSAAPGGENGLMKISNGVSTLIVMDVGSTLSIEQIFLGGKELARRALRSFRPAVELRETVLEGQRFIWQAFEATANRQKQAVLVGSTVTAKSGLLFYGMVPATQIENDIEPVISMFYSLR